MDNINEENEAVTKLKKLINKTRAHFYKPFQIAEILYRLRIGTEGIDPLVLETYRVKSKVWRDTVTQNLIGKKCTSSSKYQDNLFDQNACPPEMIKLLNDKNIREEGSIEKLIYNSFRNKMGQLLECDQYLKKNYSEFSLQEFLNLFWNNPGLKRSIDKVFEIVIYAIFQVISRELDIKSTISVNCTDDKLEKYSDFSKRIFGINTLSDKIENKASFYRLGLANASDRGLDMYSNIGSIVQVKHMFLDKNLADSVIDNISADSIIIVCKATDDENTQDIMNNPILKEKIKAIITQEDLIAWYQLCFSEEELGVEILNIIRTQMQLEFPSMTPLLTSFFAIRKY